MRPVSSATKEIHSVAVSIDATLRTRKKEDERQKDMKRTENFHFFFYSLALQQSDTAQYLAHRQALGTGTTVCYAMLWHWAHRTHTAGGPFTMLAARTYTHNKKWNLNVRQLTKTKSLAEFKGKCRSNDLRAVSHFYLCISFRLFFL